MLRKLYFLWIWGLLLPGVLSVAVKAELNVKDYGATGDGVTDDTFAIKYTFLVAESNETVLFPAGTYLIKTEDKSGIRVISQRNLIVRGEGGATLKRHPLSSDGQKWMTWIDCNNITIHDLEFDINGNTRSGGMSFYACKNVQIERNKFYDSNHEPNHTADRYAIGVLPDATYGSSEFISIVDNYFEKVQVECVASNVIFSGNFCNAPEVRGFAMATVLDDLSLSEITITNNIILDPADNAFTFGVDPTNRKGCKFENIIISNNIIICTGAASAGQLIIMAGSATENTFKNVQITDNIITDYYGVTAIEVRSTNPGLRFDNFKISGNVYEASTVSAVSYPFKLSYLRNSEISNNILRGNIANGIKIQSPEKTRFINNSVEATLTAYELSAASGTSTVSYGENIIQGNRSIGSPNDLLIAGSDASDMFIGERDRVYSIQINGMTTTVDVTGKNLFETKNTFSSTIQTLTGGYPGQIITIIFRDSLTRIGTEGNIKLNFLSVGTNDGVVQFICDGTNWYKLSGTEIFLTGDLNQDGRVNMTDFSVLAGNWFKCSDAANPDCTGF